MSDSDTTDSDCGVRYKTTTTRHKHSASRAHDRSSYRESHSSSRHSDRRRYRRSRSKTPDRRRYRRRSRSTESSSRSRTQHRSTRSSRNATPERAEPGEKVLDISVSSVSSQDDHLEQQHQQQHQEHQLDGSTQSTDCFGPSLPPSLSGAKHPDSDRDTSHCDETLGPALPPHLQDPKPEPPMEERSIGPSLPPGFILTQSTTAHDHATSESELSPFSEPDEADPDDGELIGPLPGSSGSRANVELEQRALEMKIRQIEEATAAANGNAPSMLPKAREDWMLELPDIRKVSDLGLGARQFRTREKPEIGDRSVWTDTPADRERKKNAGATGRSTKTCDPAEERERERERKLIEKRDKEQEKMAKQHKKKQKRDKTLLEIHQDKLKKEKKDSNDGARRPFNRDLDLQANRFDEAQKKAVMKKAQLLDSRFSSGSSKYL